MRDSRLPLIIEPDQLATELNMPGVTLVDICKAETYAQTHVPGAIHIDYSQFVTAKSPVMGLIPDVEQLARLLSQNGILPTDTIVAYDDEGGGKAARFIYTLDVIGHENYSLLNGGLHAWANEGHTLEATPNNKQPSQYIVAKLNLSPVATKDSIQNQLGNPDLQIIDSRSPAEFNGSKKFALKGGHIPGAKNLDWINLMDQHRNLRLKSSDEIARILQEHNISTDKPTIVYCQTHHRSALTYFALKAMGVDNIQGYPGSWSEWGNSPDTPVETDS